MLWSNKEYSYKQSCSDLKLKMNTFEKNENAVENVTKMNAQAPVVPAPIYDSHVESKYSGTYIDVHTSISSNAHQYIDNNHPVSTSNTTVQTYGDQKDTNENSKGQENMYVQTYTHDSSKKIEIEEYNNIWEYNDSEKSYSDGSTSVQNDDTEAYKFKSL